MFTLLLTVDVYTLPPKGIKGEAGAPDPVSVRI